MPRCDGDEGLADLPGDEVRPADDVGLNDGWVFHADAFDFGGADEVASRLDDIVGTATNQKLPLAYRRARSLVRYQPLPRNARQLAWSWR
jgi:hypothetical protein